MLCNILMACYKSRVLVLRNLGLRFQMEGFRFRIVR